MTRSNRSKRTNGSWELEESWRFKAIGSWFGSTNAHTTQYSEKPRSIGTARQSHGWGDSAWRSSILDASDKCPIVMGFLSAEGGVQGNGVATEEEATSMRPY